MSFDQTLVNQRIDELLNTVGQKLQKSISQETEDEEANGGKTEALSQGCHKAEKKEDDDDEDEDEDEDEDDGDEDEDDKDFKKSLLLATEAFQSLLKSSQAKDKKKKKKEKEEDEEDHKEVAVKHLCDNKEKDVHKEVALDHFKKSFEDELSLLKSEIERLKSTPVPPKGVPAGVMPLQKSESVSDLSKADALNELLSLKKADPSSVKSSDIIAVETGKADPAQILKKYKRG